ncbi:MAG: 30S ribosomal protein S6 [Mycoplasmataceae bacterium]|nr:30S ribosomal protein S6 [Mycoplasmataceae bacterium]
MAKYEIDLLVSGSLEEDKVPGAIKDLESLISGQKDYKVDQWGKKQLAYKIKKDDHAYYFIYTFDCTDAKVIAEFLRVANINPYVIRKLIINLEKDYGYKATVNQKKSAKSAAQAERYAKKYGEYDAKKTTEKVLSSLANSDGKQTAVKKVKKAVSEDDE